MADFRLRQSERLKKRKAIELLFARGRSVKVFPVRIVLIITERDGPYPARVAFTAPRKLFKRAVDRNLLKRRMREAYRLNKSLIYEKLNDPSKQLSMMIIYTSDEIHTFEIIQQALIQAIGLMPAKYIL